MPQKKNRVIQDVGIAAEALLRLTAAASDVFPPLKSAAGGALHILEIVKKFKTHKEDWNELGAFVGNAVATVVHHIPQEDESRRSDLKDHVVKLDVALGKIQREIDGIRQLDLFGRAMVVLKDRDAIRAMKEKVQEALDLFHLGAALTTGEAVENALRGVNIAELVAANFAILKDELITAAVSALDGVGDTIVTRIDRKAALNDLPYAQHVTLDPKRACQAGTRVALLEDIWAWIGRANPDGSAEIMWLHDVAGSGKTTIAHSVAQRAREQGILATSYFFSPDHPESGPYKLFTTISRDLADFDAGTSEAIVEALIAERGLATTQALTLQFSGLILDPVKASPPQRTTVIVIDSLDVALDALRGHSHNTDDRHIMLGILGDQMPQLPGCFRIFITSRPTQPIRDAFTNQVSIIPRQSTLSSNENQHDILHYATFCLREVANRKQLASGWPGEALLTGFIRTAGGLFLWVVVVSQYLQQPAVLNPDKLLRQIVSGTPTHSLAAENQMHQIYTTVLLSWNWMADPDFIEAYRVVMGCLVDLKQPLSKRALTALLGDTVPIDSILGLLGPLLSGISEDRQPIQLLHQSLRNFLTGTTHASELFSLSGRSQSHLLALKCIEVLKTKLLHDEIRGTGYSIIEESEGIPEVTGVTEELIYACQFWIAHMNDVLDSSLVAETAGALSTITTDQVIQWMEIIASKSSFLIIKQGFILLKLATPISNVEYYSVLASALCSLSTDFLYNSRHLEALYAIQEAVELYRQLFNKGPPAAFKADLAWALSYLYNCLSDHGQEDQALSVIQEAVELHSQLFSESPIAFKADLATSLIKLSNCLADNGQQDQALPVIQEAVKLYRQLFFEKPAAFKADHAGCLINLAILLSFHGQQDQAFAVIQEAVELHRQLFSERPAAFKANLALSLSSLSTHLSADGQRDQALSVNQEAVKLYKQLFFERPAAFKPDLALSLHNLSVRFFDLGQQDEALAISHEAVELRRQLFSERPAAFKADLAGSLNNLSVRLSIHGQQDEALPVIQEAVELYRQLFSERPTRFKADLALPLNNLSVHLSDCGQQDQALTVIQEAVELRRQHFSERPAAFKADLALPLYNLSIYSARCGQHDQALEAIQESISLYQQLQEERPGQFENDYDDAIELLSNLCAEVEDSDSV